MADLGSGIDYRICDWAKRAEGELLLRDEGFGKAPNLPSRPHGIERTGHELGGSCPVLFVGRFGLEELRVCQNDTELIVQLVKQQTQVNLLVHRSVVGSEGGRSRTSDLRMLFRLPHARADGSVRAVRVAPQRVDKNANRPTRRADVFDLTGGEPVVNRPAADAHQFAGFHD